MNSTAVSAAPARRPFPWRDVVLPKEHGSWSLALEPLALGLLVAPSVAGGFLAVATAAGFLARRPLKLAGRERDPVRRAAARTALAVAGAIAAGAFGGALVLGGGRWLLWLLPSVVLGGSFLWFDLQNAWRSEFAEIVGAAAFAAVSGTLAVIAGWPALPACALAFAMLARAMPTVMFVRAGVRGGKTGEYRAGPAVIAAAAAVAGAVALYRCGAAPFALIAALGLLLVRSLLWLRPPTPRLHPRTLGFIELALGLVYLATLAATWPSPIP